MYLGFAFVLQIKRMVRATKFAGSIVNIGSNEPTKLGRRRSFFSNCRCPFLYVIASCGPVYITRRYFSSSLMQKSSFVLLVDREIMDFQYTMKSGSVCIVIILYLFWKYSCFPGWKMRKNKIKKFDIIVTQGPLHVFILKTYLYI